MGPANCYHFLVAVRPKGVMQELRLALFLCSLFVVYKYVISRSMNFKHFLVTIAHRCEHPFFYNRTLVFAQLVENEHMFVHSRCGLSQLSNSDIRQVETSQIQIVSSS